MTTSYQKNKMFAVSVYAADVQHRIIAYMSSYVVAFDILSSRWLYLCIPWYYSVGLSLIGDGPTSTWK